MTKIHDQLKIWKGGAYVDHKRPSMRKAEEG